MKYDMIINNPKYTSIYQISIFYIKYKKSTHVTQCIEPTQLYYRRRILNDLSCLHPNKTVNVKTGFAKNIHQLVFILILNNENI